MYKVPISKDAHEIGKGGTWNFKEKINSINKEAVKSFHTIRVNSHGTDGTPDQLLCGSSVDLNNTTLFSLTTQVCVCVYV